MIFNQAQPAVNSKASSPNPQIPQTAVKEVTAKFKIIIKIYKNRSQLSKNIMMIS